MQNDNLTVVKNFLWLLCIIVSLGALVVGVFFAMFHRYSGGEETSLAVDISHSDSSNLVQIGTGNGIARGVLNTLEETEDAGEEYLDKITFLIDSTFLNLRDLQLVNTSKVWATTTGSLPIGSASECQIVYSDGSVITPANAAMLSKPEILMIGIGMDGLGKVDEEEFIAQYDTLISNIRAASPDTKIVCISLTSVIPGYSMNDGLTVTSVSDGNDWIQLVCRDTGAYFLNVSEEINESVQLLSRFAASNGKSLNRLGIQELLEYIRIHAVP